MISIFAAATLLFALLDWLYLIFDERFFNCQKCVERTRELVSLSEIPTLS